MAKVTKMKKLERLKQVNVMKKLISFRNLVLLVAALLTVNSISISAIPEKGKTKNIAPTINLSVTPVKKPVDIVILTDYTGAKLSALNTQINALKASFNAVNVDPVFHVINSVKKIGTQNDELYMYRRYAHLKYQVNYYSHYSPANSWDYDPYYWFDDTLLWEERQDLASNFGTLPVRSPTNITYTKTGLLIRKTTNTTTKYYDVTVRCSNDVKTAGLIEQDMYYNSDYSGYEHYWDYIINGTESASIDTEWNREEKISNIAYDVFSLDFDSLNTLPLRTGSDRHMLFISDATAKDYSKTQGNYFSFGDLTETVKNYISANNFKIYGVMPDKTSITTLLADKVNSILPLGNTSLFYMQSGEVWKLGDPIISSQMSNGEKMYPQKTSDIGTVMDIIYANGPTYECKTYMLMSDGTVKYSTPSDNKISTLSGLSNITSMVCMDKHTIYFLNRAGQVFCVDTYYDTLTSFNNPVAFSKIITNGWYEPLYLTSTGLLYKRCQRTRATTGDVTYVFSRVGIKYYDAQYVAHYKTLPAIKDVEKYSAAQNYPFIALYTTGTIQQFTNYEYEENLVSGYYNEAFYYLEDASVKINEPNVSSIESSGSSVFVYKTDGTVRQIIPVWTITTYIDEDTGKTKTHYQTTLKNTTDNVPVTNITKTYGAGAIRYYMTDNTGRTYKYNDTSHSVAVLGTSLADMGTNIKKFIDFQNTQYTLYTDNTVRQTTYLNGSPNTITSNIMLPYTNVADVYATDSSSNYGGSSNLYILLKDGSVKAIGDTDYGQLGIVNTSRVSSFTSPLVNPLTFNTTKTYYSMLDIFNNTVAGKFYPTAQYTSAFNDIYSNYSSYSGTGSAYVVLGDDIQYQSSYSDYENDPEHSRKWSISHDPYYFDNSMGLSQYHNPSGFTTSPPIKLDKVGKYTINLKARDNPKADNLFDNYRLWSLGDQNLIVYIHRKPIALQRITVTNNGNGTFTMMALDAGSYDLDHSLTRSDKGIVAREWSWRESTSTVWITGQMNKSDCIADKSYITQLRVKDVEGVWSDYASITIDKNNPPVALFDLDTPIISTTESLKVKDQSYPQSFSSITDWHWVVKKLNADGSVPSNNIQNAKFTSSNTGTGTLVGYDVNVKINYSSNGVGKYRVYLRVKDSNGLWSDGGTDSTTPADLNKYFSLDFEVDKPPTASFTIDNNIIKPTELLKVKDTSTVSGTSALAKWQWIVRKFNADGSLPSTSLQNDVVSTRNNGSGVMAGYDVNVAVDYSTYGTGKYRIYLRVMNGNGMWSDGGADASTILASCFYKDIIVDTPPTARFVIENSPLRLPDLLKLRDTSYITGVSPIDSWHWIIKKLNPEGGVSSSSLQDDIFSSSNNGSGTLAGYDTNVITDYSNDGPGTYRIYLRVRNSSNMWSDGGTDSSCNLNNFYSQDLVVQESFRLLSFRVMKVKDLHLESYYYDSATGLYVDRPINVNNMAVDYLNFGGMVDGLTKGYLFEFEIDTVNFSGSADTIKITPHFYTCDDLLRDSEERDLYWENSYHEVMKAGEGGHASWADITLDSNDRVITGVNTATWRGSYLIPGTAWAVPLGTSSANAKASRINRDIIVSFEIKGYKDGIMKYDYNLQQWPLERTVEKQPYKIGDVIRYSHLKCNLDDIDVIINRP
jgi:hypothetical protein